jgi:hypothetical protein
MRSLVNGITAVLDTDYDLSRIFMRVQAGYKRGVDEAIMCRCGLDPSEATRLDRLRNIVGAAFYNAQYALDDRQALRSESSVSVDIQKMFGKEAGQRWESSRRWRSTGLGSRENIATGIQESMLREADCSGAMIALVHRLVAGASGLL